jgi:hypothetical protein
MDTPVTPLLYQPLTTRRSRYPNWLIVRTKPLPTVIRRTSVGNDVCAVLLSTRRAISVPSVLENVAECLTWLLYDAPLPYSVCYHNIVQVLHLASHPDVNLHTFDSHQKIILVAVVELLIPGSNSRLEEALQASQHYVQQHWGARLPFVSFKEVLIDLHDFLIQVS